MADKKKAGVSVVPEFVAGEQPTADKFNAISVQLERASSELEKSVGDVWGESWPYSTSSTTKLTLPYGRNLTNDGKVNNAYDSFLDIANIARLIGPAANLNPTFPEFFDGEADPIYSVEDEVLQSTSATEERREFWLRFPPDLSSSIPAPGGTAGASLTRRTLTHDLVRASGDWCVTEDRKFTTFDPVPIGQSLTVTYQTTPQAWGTGPDVPGSTYNVIPDPNQTASTSGTQCTATPAGDGYTVQLPTASHTRINDNGTNTQLNGDGDIAEAAQLSLPRVLRDNFIAGDVIPEGFVYLRDNVTGKLYSDAVYRYNDSNTLRVENVELDVAHGFSVITIGSTITEAIHDLRYKWFRHSHDGTYGEAPIHVSSLAGILESEGDTGIYVTSQIANNWMPQYLHRDGYRADSDANDNNIMRGDLVIGKSSASPGSYHDASGLSYSLYLGDTLTGPRFYNNNGALVQYIQGMWDVTATTAVQIESGSSISLEADGYGTFQSENTLRLRSNSDDVNIQGGLELKTSSNPYVPDYLVDNVGLRVASLAGNVSATESNTVLGGLAAGPLSNGYGGAELDLWAINENGKNPNASPTPTDDGTTHFGYATTLTTGVAVTTGWVTPVFQVIHYAQQNLTFNPEDENGTFNPSWSQTSHWQTNINLPRYLYDDMVDEKGGNAVIGCMVMVKSPWQNSRWFTNGGGRFGTYGGEDIIAYIDVSSTSAPNNEVHIVVDAEGGTSGNMQAFHKDRWRVPAGDGNGDPASSVALDVKILLFVAAPTSSISGHPSTIL